MNFLEPLLSDVIGWFSQRTVFTHLGKDQKQSLEQISNDFLLYELMNFIELKYHLDI